MYKQHYSRFLTAHKDILHFAAHSHHLWPDVSREGHLRAWDDAALYSDRKWQHIFTEILPKAQKHVASRIGESIDSQRIVFGGSTHELVFRLLSSFIDSNKLTILTTDSEFHSFNRQAERLNEINTVDVIRVPVFPTETFKERFIRQALELKPDIVYFSHVFFDTGFVLENPNSFINTLSEQSSVIIIDDYHGFCAIPESFSLNTENVFLVAGGYKYAQSGEGCAFMCAPMEYSGRPLYTGWLADIESLETENKEKGVVYYGKGAFKFMGSTFDPTGLYRMNAVMDWMTETGLTTDVIHKYVVSLQDYFLEKLKDTNEGFFNESNLVTPTETRQRAHFLSFRIPHPQETSEALKKMGVITDSRGKYIRIGFGLYQDTDDVDKLVDVLKICKQRNEVTE